MRDTHKMRKINAIIYAFRVFRCSNCMAAVSWMPLGFLSRPNSLLSVVTCVRLRGRHEMMPARLIHLDQLRFQAETEPGLLILLPGSAFRPSLLHCLIFCLFSPLRYDAIAREQKSQKCERKQPSPPCLDRSCCRAAAAAGAISSPRDDQNLERKNGCFFGYISARLLHAPELDIREYEVYLRQDRTSRVPDQVCWYIYTKCIQIMLLMACTSGDYYPVNAFKRPWEFCLQPDTRSSTEQEVSGPTLTDWELILKKKEIWPSDWCDVTSSFWRD